MSQHGTVDIKQRDGGKPTDPALQLALEMEKWYHEHAAIERRKYYAMEVATIIVSASITAIGIFMPNDGRPGAVLGVVVSLLVAMRALFHWRETWRRYCEAATELAAEIRNYQARIIPYDADNTRGQQLITKVNDVEGKAVKETSKLVTDQRDEKTDLATHRSTVS
jgi:uncharacterized protein DUF4231